jgi:hypothetical protein
MKASVFIKVALIDQMQQIADLGLWFHLTTLMARGINTLVEIERKPRIVAMINMDLADWRPAAKRKMFPQYEVLPTTADHWQTVKNLESGPHTLYYSDPSEAHKNATWEREGVYNIHMPTLFEDFKEAARKVVTALESGEIPDNDMVSKNVDEQ